MEYKVGDRVTLTEKTLTKLKNYPKEYISGIIIENFPEAKGAKVRHDDGNIWGWTYKEILKLPKP